jgi:hypothetical protein
MRRFGLIFVVAMTTWVGSTPAANAGSIWDPNEPLRRLDIRWVGVAAEQDGRFRVTIVFHHPVRLRWFQDDATAEVGFTHDRVIQPYWFFTFRKGLRPGRIRARLCEGGSGCGHWVRARRPDMFAIRAWLQPLYDQPQVGWSFRAKTYRDSFDVVLDRTRWGTI